MDFHINTLYFGIVYTQMSIGVLGNLLVIAIYIWKKNIREKSCNVLILALAIADIEGKDDI